MKKTVLSTLIAGSMLFAANGAMAQNNWDFGEEAPMSQAQKQEKFEERKANVIKRLEAGKKALIERMDARIKCAKEAKEPREMKACHKTYRLHANEKEMLAPIE